jgi:hypothetical protein
MVWALGEGAEALLAVPFEGLRVREAGGVGGEVDALSGGGQKGKGGGGGAAGFGVEEDFVLVGDGEDAAVERRKKLSQLSLGGHH